MSLVSIIVPVYKAEIFLNKCVDSILCQTYKNWELLLIDDGSPDKSGAICDSYASKDSRIKVFHKNNGGVSSARNYGLNVARGKWIMFVDADDWLEFNTLELCMQFSSYDIVRFSLNFVYDKLCSNIQTYDLSENLTKDELLNLVVARKTLLGVWCSMYRTSLFSDLRFNESITNGEDWLMLVNLINKSTTVQIVNKALYNYNCFNESSCIATINTRKVDESLFALELISNDICNLSYRSAIVNAYVDLLFLRLRLAPSLQPFYGKNITLHDILLCNYPLKKRIYVSLFYIIFHLYSLIIKKK